MERLLQAPETGQPVRDNPSFWTPLLKACDVLTPWALRRWKHVLPLAQKMTPKELQRQYIALVKSWWSTAKSQDSIWQVHAYEVSFSNGSVVKVPASWVIRCQLGLSGPLQVGDAVRLMPRSMPKLLAMLDS